MRKTYALLLTSAFTLSAFAKSQYLPEDLSRLHKSNQCVGCDLSEVRFSMENFYKANLTNALLVRSHFYSSTFYSSTFDGANLVDVYAYNLKASGSSFKNANLEGSDFSHANLSSCDFTGANITNVDFSYTDLARAKLTDMQLKQVKSLKGAIMPDGTIYKDK